jgi:uncharacterized phage protein gp47/JayE
VITIPTIQQLTNSIISNFEAEFGVILDPNEKEFLVALATVQAAKLYLNYLEIGSTQKNIWFDTADSVAIGGTLERFGVAILERWPFPAVAGQYTLTVTGTAGATIDGTTVFKSNDASKNPGMLYQITAPYTMPGTTGTITVNALIGGSSSSLLVGNSLTVTSPIANVNASATVTSETVAPTDAESLEDYRQKIRDKVQLVPGGWSAIDYRLVGDQIAGIGQTYAYAASGQPNVVNVFLQGTIPGSAIDPTIIAQYQTAVDLVRPLIVFQVVTAASPINDIVITITNAAPFSPFTTDQKALITSALTSLINSVHPFIAAADATSDRNDIIGLANLSSTISNAVPGFGFSTVTFTVNGGSPVTNWKAENGNVPFLNSVTYL